MKAPAQGKRQNRSFRARLLVLLSTMFAVFALLLSVVFTAKPKAGVIGDIVNGVNDFVNTVNDIKQVIEEASTTGYINDQNQEIRNCMTIFMSSRSKVDMLEARITEFAKMMADKSTANDENIYIALLQNEQQLHDILEGTYSSGTIADKLVYGQWAYVTKTHETVSYIKDLSPDYADRFSMIVNGNDGNEYVLPVPYSADYESEYVQPFQNQEKLIEVNKTEEYKVDEQKSKSLADYALGVTSGIGILFILIYSVIHMIQIVTKDQASLEGWLRLFILTTLGILAVIFSIRIMHFIEQLGLNIYGTISTRLENAASSGTYLTSLQIEGGAIQKVIIFIVMWMTYIAIVAGAYGLLFELCLRHMFMPIALASIAHDGIVGMRGSGVKFLFMYFGMFLRMVAFSAIILLYSFAINYANVFNGTTSIGYLFEIIAIRMAAQALIGSSSNLIREVFT